MTDTVEVHNVANQLPGMEFEGWNKLEANEKLVKSLVHPNIEVELVDRYFTDADEITGEVVVAALDRLDQRRIVFDMTRCNGLTELFIDFRVGGRVIKGYIFNPNDLDDCDVYDMSLVDQSLQAETACTEKMCIQSVLYSSAEMAEAIVKWSKNKFKSYKITKDFNINYEQRVLFAQMLS